MLSGIRVIPEITRYNQILPYRHRVQYSLRLPYPLSSFQGPAAPEGPKYFEWPARDVWAECRDGNGKFCQSSGHNLQYTVTIVVGTALALILN